MSDEKLYDLLSDETKVPWSVSAKQFLLLKESSKQITDPHDALVDAAKSGVLSGMHSGTASMVRRNMRNGSTRGERVGKTLGLLGGGTAGGLLGRKYGPTGVGVGAALGAIGGRALGDTLGEEVDLARGFKKTSEASEELKSRRRWMGPAGGVGAGTLGALAYAAAKKKRSAINKALGHDMLLKKFVGVSRDNIMRANGVPPEAVKNLERNSVLRGAALGLFGGALIGAGANAIRNRLRDGKTKTSEAQVRARDLAPGRGPEMRAVRTALKKKIQATCTRDRPWSAVEGRGPEVQHIRQAMRMKKVSAATVPEALPPSETPPPSEEDLHGFLEAQQLRNEAEFLKQKADVATQEADQAKQQAAMVQQQSSQVQQDAQSQADMATQQQQAAQQQSEMEKQKADMAVQDAMSARDASLQAQHQNLGMRQAITSYRQTLMDVLSQDPTQQVPPPAAPEASMGPPPGAPPGPPTGPPPGAPPGPPTGPPPGAPPGPPPGPPMGPPPGPPMGPPPGPPMGPPMGPPTGPPSVPPMGPLPGQPPAM